MQMDVKATNSDGSVRHAVLTLYAPEIAANGNLAVMLAKDYRSRSLQAYTRAKTMKPRRVVRR